MVISLQHKTSRLFPARRAFTMLEVIVAIMVMSMMLIGMFSIISYGMETWQSGQGKLNAVAYNRMTYELVKTSLLEATSVDMNVGSITTKLDFSAPVKNRLGTGTVKFSIATGTQVATQAVLFKKIINKGTFANIDEINLDDGVSPTTVYSRHFNMIIAKNVMNFLVERPSSYTVKIHLQLGQETTNDDDGDGYLDLETVSSQTLIFLTPGVN